MNKTKINMRSLFVRTIEKVKRAPWFRTTVETVIASASVVEIANIAKVAMNASTPARYRALAVIRGSCCLIALVTSHMASRAPNPGLQAAFRVYCTLSSSMYGLTGGDLGLALSYAYISKLPILAMPKK